MQVHSNPVIIFSIHLNAVNMAEVSQKSHQICFCVYHMTDAVFRPHQQSHFCVLLALLWTGQRCHINITKQDVILAACMRGYQDELTHHQSGFENTTSIKSQITEILQIMHLCLQCSQLKR